MNFGFFTDSWSERHSAFVSSFSTRPERNLVTVWPGVTRNVRACDSSTYSNTSNCGPIHTKPQNMNMGFRTVHGASWLMAWEHSSTRIVRGQRAIVTPEHRNTIVPCMTPSHDTSPPFQLYSRTGSHLRPLRINTCKGHLDHNNLSPSIGIVRIIQVRLIWFFF